MKCRLFFTVRLCSFFSCLCTCFSFSFSAAAPSLSLRKSPTPEAVITMTCANENPSTLFETKQTVAGDLVNMHVHFLHGAEFAAISDDLVTPADLDKLRQQADMIKQLGNDWNFQWKRSGCNADAPTFFQCVGDGVDFEINGIKIHPVAFTVTDVEQKSMWGVLKHKNVAFDFKIDNIPYRTMMNYQPMECFQ